MDWRKATATAVKTICVEKLGCVRHCCKYLRMRYVNTLECFLTFERVLIYHSLADEDNE